MSVYITISNQGETRSRSSSVSKSTDKDQQLYTHEQVQTIINNSVTNTINSLNQSGHILISNRSESINASRNFSQHSFNLIDLDAMESTNYQSTVQTMSVTPTNEAVTPTNEDVTPTNPSNDSNPLINLNNR